MSKIKTMRLKNVKSENMSLRNVKNENNETEKCQKWEQ